MTAAMTAEMSSFDVVLVGGGLASGLCALALRRRHPRLRLGLCEAGASLGGNHTWSFFGSDVGPEAAALLDPLVVARWSAVKVAFPDHQRQLATSYASISSSALDQALRPVFAPSGSALLLGRRATLVGAHQVVLEGGQTLRAPVVLDGRGPGAAPRWAENQGFQKFVGLEVEIEPSAALDAGTAVIMDAQVPQTEGFRFAYLLPFSPTRVLVEDTYYADGPELDRHLLRARALAYLARRGLKARRVLREEAGVLPIPWTDDSVPPLGWPLRLGARGGWFHPTTGYSLPLAVKVALAIAPQPAQALPALQALHRRHAPQARFARQLNRLLFRALPPEARWASLSRFYRLPQPLIERFYALEASPLDQARLLMGRPPRGISLRAAFSALQTV
jgi:lycopene beta-cyclase